MKETANKIKTFEQKTVRVIRRYGKGFLSVPSFGVNVINGCGEVFLLTKNYKILHVHFKFCLI